MLLKIPKGGPLEFKWGILFTCSIVFFNFLSLWPFLFAELLQSITGVPNLFVSASPLTSIASPHWYKCTQVNTTLRPLASPRLGTTALEDLLRERCCRLHTHTHTHTHSTFNVIACNIFSPKIQLTKSGDLTHITLIRDY